MICDVDFSLHLDGMSFGKWVRGEIGTSGVDMMFKPFHFISVGVVFVVIAAFLCVAYSKKVSYEKKEKVLRGVAWFLLCYELTWRIIHVLFKETYLSSLWTNYPCHLSGILIPIICLCNWKTGKKAFYSFAFISGIVNFIYPKGVFTNTTVTFLILRNLIQHGGLLLIPLYEVAMKKYRASVKDYPYTLLGIMIHMFNCEVLARICFKGPDDYMYLRSGLPFTVDGVPNWIITLSSALIFIFIFMFFADFKTSVKSLKKKTAEKE